jgi:hypothetical protein
LAKQKQTTRGVIEVDRTNHEYFGCPADNAVSVCNSEPLILKDVAEADFKMFMKEIMGGSLK